MKRDDQPQDVSRRAFLRGTGFLGLSGAVSAISGPLASAAQPARQPAPATSGYDLNRLRQTDATLVHFEQVGVIRSPYERPQRIAFGPGGLLWLAAGRRVAALKPDGGKQTELSFQDDVRSVALAANGEILVGVGDHIEVHDVQGHRLAQWKAVNKKAWITSLAVGEKDVFASDAGNRAVYRYDRAGQLVGRIGDKDAARDIPAYVVPSPYFDLEIGADGLLWVANPGCHQLQAFTFDGQLEKKWGEPSFGIAGFCGCCNPSYFTRLSDGRFVTSEKGLPRVKVYSAEGRFESVVAGTESFPKYLENITTAPIPMDVAADAEGRIHVADTLGNEIRIFRRARNV
jgi:hypothetical protein